jgi:hypothetical protein
MSTGIFQPLQHHFSDMGTSGWSSVNDLSASHQASFMESNLGIPHKAPAFDLSSGILATDNYHMPTTATMSSVSPTTSPGDGSSKASRKRSADTSPATTGSGSPPEEDRVCKRQRNTDAARRYRQRKVDRVSELEEALAAMTKANEELKLKLAKSETEVTVLRGLVGKS